jgi:uncharacterized protein YcfL
MKTNAKNGLNVLLPLAGAVFLMAAIVTATGCSTAGIRAGDSSATNEPYLIVDDPSIGDQISIVKVAHDHVGEIMRANVTLRNNRSRSLQMQYRISWFDANGMEIDGQGKPYRDVVIEGKDTINVTGVAPSPAATEFKIRVRKLKAVKIQNIL